LQFSKTDVVVVRDEAAVRESGVNGRIYELEGVYPSQTIRWRSTLARVNQAARPLHHHHTNESSGDLPAFLVLRKKATGCPFFKQVGGMN
jgi:hypothetical protein